MFPSKNISLLVFFVSCLIISVSSQNDDTIRDGTPGKDVVEAVIRRIDKAEIFEEDNSFLIRLAYVESRFGTANHTFRQDYYGGIWQVEESIFRITQTNHSSLTDLHAQIEAKLNINWLSVTWRRLMSPLYSGLAAALYFSRVPDAIPQAILEQADHWRKYYRPLGEIQRFADDSEDLRNRTRCRGKMDLCIVLDSSGSINQNDDLNYDRAKNFTAIVIESFSLDFTRIGMLVYSDGVEDIFPVRNNLTIPLMAALARNATYLDSGTRTDLGILRAIEMFKDTPNAGGVPRVLTVLTDGDSDRDSNLTYAIQSIIENNIKSISVGIGHSINRNELLLIALNDSRSVFQLEGFSFLQDFLFQLTSITCEVPQKPEINGTYEDSLQQNEKRIYQIQLPPLGITLSIGITVGKANGYWSFTEEVPSSAVNDGTFDDSTYIPPPGSLRQAGENDTDSGVMVYFAIEGLEVENNYTISAVEGGTRQDTTTTTTTTTGSSTTTGDSTTTEISTTTGGSGIERISWASALIIGLMSTSHFLYFAR